MMSVFFVSIVWNYNLANNNMQANIMANKTPIGRD